MTELNCTVELKGGLELLFENCKKIELKLSPGPTGKCTVRSLIQHLKTNYLKERPELFVSGDDIRPGILIIINETDSELLGHLDYEVQNNDNVLFISTLHGG